MRHQGGEPDWEEIKKDYDEPGLKVADICSRHGVTSGKLYRRIKRYGWMKRSSAICRYDGSAETPTALLARLANIIMRRIGELEDMTSDQTRSETALDSERQAKAIAALVRSIDQLASVEDRLRQRQEKARPLNDPNTVAWGADLAEAMADLAAAQARSGAVAQSATRTANLDVMGAKGTAGSAAAD